MDQLGGLRSGDGRRVEISRDLATGKGITGFAVVADLAMIVEDAVNQILTTGDRRSKEALRGFIEGLIGVQLEPLFTLMKEPPKRRVR